MFEGILRYYHTLRHLQWKQIRYRLQYKLQSNRPLATSTNVTSDLHTSNLQLLKSIDSNVSWLGNNTFQFLNLKYHFKHGIDWNYSGYGKLWTYNLTYFEFLSQSNISKKEGLDLINDFIRNLKKIRDGIEPFPLSLRAFFWIKFIIKHQINNDHVNRCLYEQLNRLSKKPEYHLLGNHLLENAYSLLYGACYFDDPKLLKQAELILFEQLEEQILPDGAHFELTPMYHQLMLYRVLDCINLLSTNNIVKCLKLLDFLIQKAKLMLGWLKEMAFKNGAIPHVNDSAPDIAPDTTSLLEYALRLGLSPDPVKLKESGYRKFFTARYEALIDVGNIGPDYIPGHAHSDTFNFIILYQSAPFIVDPGISTYEKNARRNLERSTASHNTVMVEEKEQSEVWGGFRVARRAKVVNLIETENQVTASHDGYKHINASHTRVFNFEEQSISIKDKIGVDKTAKAFFHFHPAVKPLLTGQEITHPFGKIKFEQALHIYLETYSFAHGFNHVEEATKAVVTFSEILQTKIVFS